MPGMGRLIGPKTWDRSIRIFGSRLDNLSTVTDCYGFLCDNLLNKLCFSVYKTENGMEFGSKKWNRGSTSGLPVDSPLLGFETIRISPWLCELDKNHPCVVCLNC